MDANDARRQRLRDWIDADFDGRVSALCKHYGLPDSMASYLSQLLSKHRNFGERAARALEQKCGKPEGWLEGNTVLVEDIPNPLDVDLSVVAKLPVAERRKIEDFIAYVIAGHQKRERLISVNRVVSSQVDSQETVKKAMTKPPKLRPVIGSAKQGRKTKA